MLVASGDVNGVYLAAAATRMTRLGQAQGMLNNDVWSVLRDDNGYIWMNSTRGLERFGSDGAFSLFQQADRACSATRAASMPP